MPNRVRVSCDEDPLVWYFDAFCLCVTGRTPLKVKYVVVNQDPLATQVLGDIEFLIDFAGLVCELCTARPTGSQRPISLDRVEHKFLDFLATVKCPSVRSTVLRNPVDTLGAFRIRLVVSLQSTNS